MNTYITKKYLLPTLALVCLAPLASQKAQAAATFSSYATVTYTINTLITSNPGNFSGLGITGSLDLAPDGDIQYITGDGSVTPSLAGAGSTSLTPVAGSSYSRTFQLEGTANNGGVVGANFLAGFGLAFNNASANRYDVGLTLSYELSANASGDNSFTDVTLTYYNQDETVSNIDTPDYVKAPQDILVPDYLSASHDFYFILTPGSSDKLSVDAGITGTLQASPVPVPSAIWLFASALLAIPGIKKSKRTV